jgi:hypothetical protein
MIAGDAAGRCEWMRSGIAAGLALAVLLAALLAGCTFISPGALPPQTPPATGEPGPVPNLSRPEPASGLVEVPDISGMVDPDPVLENAGLKPEGVAIHGPIESDAAGIGEAYRQDPAAGTLVPKGGTVTYHFWWESQ